MDFISLAEAAALVSLLIFIYCNRRYLRPIIESGDHEVLTAEHIVLLNLENLLIWIYIWHFPVGLLWALHLIHSFCTLVFLILYLRRIHNR
jgi:hypothetical protein